MVSFSSLGALLRQKPDAAAVISGGRQYPRIRGEALFYQTRDGVMVCVRVAGLPRGGDPCDSPVFALHIHEGGDCGDGFSRTGGHYDPQGRPHPCHAGDLPPLFSADGSAFLAVLTDRFQVNRVLGKTLVIHSRRDDFTTQPAGDAGEKIACGEIRPVRR